LQNHYIYISKLEIKKKYNNKDYKMSKELINRMVNLRIPIVLLPLEEIDSQTLEDSQTEELDKQQPLESTQGKYIVMFSNRISNHEDTDYKCEELDKIPGFKSRHIYNNTFHGCCATINKGLMRQLMNDPDILYIERDELLYETGYEKVPIDSQNFEKAVAYWHQTITNTVQTATDNFSTVHCYVLDTGILANHTEFSLGQVVMDYNAISKSNRAQDDNGHGTGVASIIGGKTTGVANRATLHSIKVLDSTGAGYTSDIIAGLNWVIANKRTPCVINMSLTGAFSSTLNTAVQNCINAGIQVICAAGNEGIDAGSLSPANSTAVITTSAYDSSKTRPNWSNYGSVVDTFAPGASLRAAWGDSTTSYFLVSGTSFASPLVAGIICRFLQARPNSKPTDIKSYLKRTSLLNEIINTGSDVTPNERIVWDQNKVNPC